LISAGWPPATDLNQLTGYGYDTAGNIITNASTSYVYDAENRLVWTSQYRYIYDGDGNRVEKCAAASATTACPTSGTTGTLYWRGTGSDTLDETDLAGNALEDYIFFNGARIARRDVSNDAVHFYFSDQVGSHAVVENATGTGCEQDIDYYPYGGVEEDYCSTPVAQHYKFTGKERDSESGLDMFGARYYGSSLARFMTPDWAAKPISVPYADFGNPQSLNLYSYVKNNPTTTRDLDGHCEDTLTAPICIGGAIGGPPGAVIGLGVGIVITAGVAAYIYYHHNSDDTANKNAPPPASAQGQSQSQSTPADPNGKKDDGGTKKTEHGQQRADEAREGDAHRDVGDVNRTINEGKQYTDSDTGNNVSVRGNRVVITNEDGDVVSQFKNTRANTQQRIDDGKWVPKPKPEPEPQ
jgi:RHS repeat-associated protein